MGIMASAWMTHLTSLVHHNDTEYGCRCRTGCNQGFQRKICLSLAQRGHEGVSGRLLCRSRQA